jgi:hypothetical protein
MKLSKQDFCDTCREKQLHPDFTLEEFLDGKGYNMPTGYFMGNHMILVNFEKMGGCSSCINLLKKATQS